MEDNHHHHHLRHPLLQVTTTTSLDFKNKSINLIMPSSNSKIILRLVFVTFIGSLSIWANHESSKGFEIVVRNDLPDSASGKLFHLYYVSNDKATRLVFEASTFIENLLYPHGMQTHKKQVRHVTLRLAGRNLTHKVAVDAIGESNPHGFVIHLSSSIMEESNFSEAMSRAVERGMARVWLFDNNAPKSLVNGMVEYITSLAELSPTINSGGGCWSEEDQGSVASFLSYCEGRRKGFIQRLNQGMRGEWNDRTVDDALGVPAQQLWASYISHLKEGTSSEIYWSEG